MKRELISTSRLAEICGVSQGTVDRALHDRAGISPKTKERILRVAREYGYRPNLHARSMKGGRSMLIGVVVFDLDNEFFAELVSRIEQVCTALGYYTIIMLTKRDPKRERQCLDNLYRMSVDGIVLCPINDGEEYGNFLRSLEIPTVTVGNRIAGIPYAGIDNRAAMGDATRHLLERGYQRLIYVMPTLHPDRNSFAQTERLLGAREAADGASVDLEIVSLEEALSLPVPTEPTAFLCASDLYALRLYRRAERDGFGLMGFDNLGIIDTVQIKLNSVSQDLSATAEYAVQGLLSPEENLPVIPHALVLRDKP